MRIPVHITFRGLEASAVLEDTIRERVDELERHYGHLVVGCRIVIEAGRHLQRKFYHVRVNLTVAGESSMDRVPAGHHAQTDVCAAVGHAFDDAERQLEEHIGTHVAARPPATLAAGALR